MATKKEETKTTSTTSAAKKKTTATKTSTRKRYGEHDLIDTRSITVGELIYIGQKTKNRYVWANSGDTAEVEVGDLNYLKHSNSPYLFNPLIIIEDEEFLSQPSWKDLRDMYNEVKTSDINDILNLPLKQFEAILPTLKKGYKDALLAQMSTLIEAGEFDSINKIKAVDKQFGTTLMILV